MSSYIKPQNPLYNEAADVYIYPLTTVDQIVLSNGERLNESYFGKGIELNYSIIGGLEEPENPTENMIWVETDVNITNHIISKNEPKNPEEGMVWIYNNNASNVNFYKLKYGDMGVDEVYPISAKQYVGGAWVDKTAKSYLGGEWVEWITYLYNKGNQYTDITGDWENAGNAMSGGGGGVFTFGENSIHYAGSGTSNGPTPSIATVNKINLSKHTRLKVRVAHTTGTGNFFGVCYTDTKTHMYNNAIARTIVHAPYTGVVELDLSGAGEHYVGIYSMANAQLSIDTTVYEVWLE